MNSGRKLNWLLLTSVTLSFSLLGCGPSAGLNGPTGTVAGKVTMGGKPVTNAAVTFFGESNGDTATAILQSDGTYTLKYGSGFSVPVGDYRVAITSATANQAPPDPQALMATPEKFAPNESIPAKYRDKATSGFIAVVKPGSNSSVDFELKE